MSIQVFRPQYDIENCLQEIRECLEIGWTGMGFKTVKFEEEWKRYTGYRNAYFVNSATAALNLAFDILKTENKWVDEDEIISTPLTFVSTNHAIKKAGLKAVFADVDETFCLNPEDVKRKITSKTKGVCFVAMGGNIGNYEKIVQICKENNLKLVLDAAHMAGTKFNGVVPGRDADVVCWSFQAVKNLPTGDSGMVCFRDDKLDVLARQRAWLGINKDTYARTSLKDGKYKWKYDVDYVGNKYNGNSIMAAIALAQLPHLDKDNEYRRYIASLYKNYLREEESIHYPLVIEGCLTSQHLFQILVDDRDGCLEYMNKKGIYPGVHYVVNTEYNMYTYAKNTCPNAEYISEHTLSLPCHLAMNEEDVIYISSVLKEFLNQ